MTPEDWGAAVRLRMFALVNCLALGLLGAALVTVFQPERYRAVGTVYVVATTAQVTATDLYRGGQLANQRALLYATLATSPRVLDPVIATLSLPVTAEALQERVEVVPAGAGSLLVSASDATPSRAATLVDAVSSELAKLVGTLESGPAGPPVELRIGTAGSVDPAPESPVPWRNLGIGAGAGAVLALGVVAVTAGLLHLRRRRSGAVWVHLRHGDTDELVLGRVVGAEFGPRSDGGIDGSSGGGPDGRTGSIDGGPPIVEPLVRVPDRPRLLDLEQPR